MKTDAKTIKARLKRFIEKNPKINQTTIALELKLSKSHISQVLDNKRKGDVDLLIKIAEIAGTSLLELLVGETIPNNDLKKIECIPEQAQPCKHEMDGLLAKAREVLKSNTPWADNMRMNIISTYSIFKSEQSTGKKSG